MADAVRCRCRCHLYALADRRNADGTDPAVIFAIAQAVREWEGVDVSDPVDAATACPDCLPRHCPTLLERRAWAPLPSPVEPEPQYEASPDATGGDRDG